jgi:hypothetical protein
MHKRTLGRKRATVMVVLFTVALLAAGVLIFTGCESEQQRKEKEFKAQWTKTMEDFQTRVTKDDQKAQTLVDKNDLPGVISLVKARISSVDETLGKLLALYPPPELRKLQGLTAYYRLQAQNNYYEALLAGSPTTDAQTLMNEAVTRSTIIARELSIELQKQGITLRAPSTPQKTPSSTPSSTPSTSPSK